VLTGPVIINGAIDLNNSSNGQISFWNAQVLMAPNSEIKVRNNSNLSIENTRINACNNKMWNKIGVEDGHILIDESTIYDGKTAVLMEDNHFNSYHITNTKFRDNHIGLKVVSFVDPSSTLHSTSFETYNLLLEPHDSENAYIGAFFRNSPYLQIGDNNQNQNLFKELDYGIVAFQGGVRVYNSSFNNIHDVSPHSLHSSYTTAGIYSFQADVNVQNSAFTDYYAGIESREGNIHATQNSFSNGTVGLRFRDIVNKNVSFQENTLNNQYMGVFGVNVDYGSFQINQNDVWDCYNGFAVKGVLPQIGMNNRTFNDNCLDNIDFVGISGEMVRGLQMKRNRITDVSAIGISLRACQNGIYAENLISAQYNAGLSGFQMSMGGNWNSLYCNWISSFEHGMLFRQFCWSSLKGNTLSMNDNGISFYNGGQIGIQGVAPAGTIPNGESWDNRWISNPPMHEIYNYSGADGILSPFYVRPNSFPWTYVPVNKYPTFGPLEIPINLVQASNPEVVCPQFPNCGTGGGPGPTPSAGHYQSIVANVLNSIQQNPTADAEAYLSQQASYELLLADSSWWINQSELIDFADSAREENVGYLHRIEEGLLDENYTQTLPLLDSLLVVENVEQSRKSLYRILLELYAQGDSLKQLSDSALAVVRDIAQKCPFEHGKAVYQARSMAAYFDSLGVTYHHSCEDIPSNPNARLAISEATSHAAFPNPCINSFQLEKKEEWDTALLSDALGRVVLEHHLEEGLNQINVSHLNPGSYLLVLLKGDKQLSQQQIQIIR
jgi:hypothetical protein